MRKTTVALMLALAPAYLAAQSQTTGQTGSQTTGAAQTDPGQSVPAGFSASTNARLAAMVTLARREGLPTQPLTDRMAEGQAKGATEAQIVAATELAHAQLVASHQALVQAGREQPSQEEVARGAQVIAGGMAAADLFASLGIPLVQGAGDGLLVSLLGSAGASLNGGVSGLGAGLQAGLGIGLGAGRKP